MPHLVFTSASEWLGAVERRVSDPEIADALRSRDLPLPAGVTPRDAKRARIALITVGAQVFVAMPGSTGRPVRQLQMPHRP